MHDTGRRENHATGLDRNIVPIFEGYDPFSLNDIKYLVLDGVFVEAGGLSGSKRQNRTRYLLTA